MFAKFTRNSASSFLRNGLNQSLSELARTEVPGGIVRAEIFVTRDVTLDRLFVTEGRLKIVWVDELGEIAGELTPSALFGLRALTLV